PTAPAQPAAALPRPSASTPRVTERKSGRTQVASLMRWDIVIVPAAFIAAATLATANGAIKLGSKDHSRLNFGSPIHAASTTGAKWALPMTPARAAIR